MNINMIDASEKSKVFMDKNKYAAQSADNARIAEFAAGYSLDITGKVMENTAYGKEDLQSMEDISMAAGLVDVSTQRNYMAVMSNSMSEEDFSDLLKDGCNPTNTKIEEAVTSLDRLKARMAESGQIIEGFNDNLDNEDVKKALGIGQAIMPLTDENIVYMLKNSQEPTIENLYMAEHSSQADSYSTMGIKLDKPDIAWEDIRPQAEKIIAEAGFGIDEEILQDAKWMVEKQIPLTKENIKMYLNLKQLSLPAESNDLEKAISVAMEEGKTPEKANLLKTESLYKEAADLVSDFAKISDNGDITKRRQLEEIRLAMTVEANLVLLRKGITVDTSDLSNLVETLKKAEEEFYRPLLENDTDKPKQDVTDLSTEDINLRSKIDLFKETERVVALVKEAPIKAIGDTVQLGEEYNLKIIGETGVKIASEYEKAGRSYETLMTAPRADMGDSISKAFRNVDDILDDLGLEKSDSNRRAVRILGYSEIQINRENIEQVRIAANTLESVIDLMTPARTLKMIREGHNPLVENLYELEQELKKETPEESTEKYAEFLVRLEKKGDITEDEKSAYIGIYRLFDKIEKKDSRVIGKVLSAGEDLNLKNLLSAYRSGRFGHIDINIDDEFGMLESLTLKGESITDQIEKGFKEMVSEEIPKEYISDKMNMIEAAAAEETAVKFLEEIEIPVTVENIMAASDYIGRGRSPFKKLTDRKAESDGNEQIKRSVLRDAEKVIDEFSGDGDAEESYKEFIGSSKDAVEVVMKNANDYMDLKEWALLNKQITIAGNLPKSSEYEIPIETDEGKISVHLRLKQTGDGEGKVEASYTDEKYGEIRSIFSVDGSRVSGIISAKYEGGFNMIRGMEQKFREEIENAGFETENITYVKSNSLREVIPEKGNTTNRNLFKVAGIFLKTMRKGVA